MSKTILTLAFIFLALLSCKKQENNNYSIIPKPLELETLDGQFQLSGMLKYASESDQLMINDYILASFKTDFEIDLKATTDGQELLSIKLNTDIPAEGYEITINKSKIVISASQQAGVIYAFESLKQLIATNNQGKQGQYLLPCTSVKDAPAFKWRGFMLDHSRHIQTIDELKQALDLMTSLKLNRFHMHLSDDQGFRLEIESYPKLNTIGSWRVDYNTSDESRNAYWGRPEQQEGEKATYGGYYTKDQIRELIAYAKERNIEILPEIDVPGHARAIIAAYPEISCSGEKTYVATGWSRLNNTVCPSNEKTYELLDAVFAEVAELFPMEYIHVGGDECYRHYWDEHDACKQLMKKHHMKDNRELQSYFVHRMEEIINKHGKKMIGWNEILDGGIAPNATVMSWIGEEGGIKSAKMGHDVIMSPNSYHYIDLKQGQSEFEPNIGYGKLLLSKVYSYKVIPDALDKEEAKFIIGTQANLWTENLDSWDKITYMALPRLYAVAENAWTPYENKNWEDFIRRLKVHTDLLDQNGTRYAKSVYNPWLHHRADGKNIKVWFSSEIPNVEIRYTLDGSIPHAASPLFESELLLDKTTHIHAAVINQGQIMGNVISKTLYLHKGAGAEVKVNGDVDQNSKLTDLNYGGFLEEGDKNWEIYDGDAFIELNLNEKTDIDSVTVRSMRHTLNGWYAASQIQLFSKEKGEFIKQGDSGFLAENTNQGRNVFINTVHCNIRNANQIFVKVRSCRTIPPGHVNAGKQAKLLIDEIIIQ
jgi:hexosaminidase